MLPLLSKLVAAKAMLLSQHWPKSSIQLPGLSWPKTTLNYAKYFLVTHSKIQARLRLPTKSTPPTSYAMGWSSVQVLHVRKLKFFMAFCRMVACKLTPSSQQVIRIYHQHLRRCACSRLCTYSSLQETSQGWSAPSRVILISWGRFTRISARIAS